MPKLTFENPNTQLPIRTLQKQDISQGGVAALGTSVFKAGQAQVELQKITQQRQRDTAGYNTYLEFGKSSTQALQAVESMGGDPLIMSERGQAELDHAFQVGKEHALEGGYEKEYLKHAVPKYLGEQSKFLNMAHGKIEGYELAQGQMKGQITTTNIVENFPPIATAQEVTQGKNTITLEMTPDNLALVQAEMNTYATEVNKLLMSDAKKNELLQETHSNIVEGIIRKYIDIDPDAFLNSNGDVYKIKLPVVVNGELKLLSHAIDMAQRRDLKIEAQEAQSRLNKAENARVTQNKRQQTLIDDQVEAETIGAMIARENGIATTHQLIVQTKNNTQISNNLRSSLLTTLDAYGRERDKESDPRVKRSLQTRIEIGEINPDPHDPIGAFPTDLEIVNANLSVNDNNALLKQWVERKSSIETLFRSQVKQEATVLARLLRKKSRLSMEPGQQEAAAEFIVGQFVSNARVLPLDKQTPEHLQLLASNTLKNGVRIMQEAGFAPLSGIVNENMQKFFKELSMDVRRPGVWAYAAAKGEITPMEGINAQTVHGLLELSEGEEPPPTVDIFTQKLEHRYEQMVQGLKITEQAVIAAGEKKRKEIEDAKKAKDAASGKSDNQKVQDFIKKKR